MGPAWLTLMLLGVLACATGAASVHRGRAAPPTAAVAALEPPRRPLEDIAEDARALGAQFHQPPRGMSWAKYDAVRQAYDRVLAEGCAALGVEHLLDVLPRGTELDAERTRVEGLLWLSGLRIDAA